MARTPGDRSAAETSTHPQTREHRDCVQTWHGAPGRMQVADIAGLAQQKARVLHAFDAGAEKFW